MYPILLEVGPFTLRSYGLFFALAFLVATLVAAREAERKGLGREVVFDFATYAALAGLAGARLYYIAFSDPQWFLSHPWEIPAVWKGGLAVHGGLLGRLLAGLAYCRYKRIPLWRFADTLAPALILGQGMGRLACFFSGDAYGAPTSVPWAITFTDPESIAPLGVSLHPTALYELALDLGLFTYLWRRRRQVAFEGQLFLMYVMGYAVIRFLVEPFRGDALWAFEQVRAAQAISVVAFAAALIAYGLLRRWHLAVKA